MRVGVRSLGLLVVLTLVVVPAWGSFSGTDVVLPSVGRAPGSAGSQWYTCMWIHNPQGGPVDVQVQFLERNKSNVNPLVWSATIPAGDTQRLDNAVETLFGVSSKFGALHITSSDKVLVVGRIYSMPQGGEAQDSVGQFFSAVPTSFAIASGQSTTLLGVYQTNPQTSSEFRYNFGFVEVGGGTATVKVTALQPDGTTAGNKSYTLGAWEPRQYNITDLLPAVNAANLRLKVEVLAGSGKVVAFGSGLANRSNDPSTFEMSFSDELLGGGGGLTSVAHDASLTGNGTASTLLGVASGGVQTSHLADAAVTTSKLAAAGSDPGQVLTSNGTSVVWQTPSTGGGGGLTSVVHDATLSGEGTVAVPLRLADGAVGKAKLAAVGGTSGQVLGTDGTTLVWQTPSGSGGGGDITAVNAGTGLSGGGSTGDVTLQVANGGISTTLLADGAVTDAKVASGIAYFKLAGAPTSLAPNGPAGGSLAGTYPNPLLAGNVVGTAQLSDLAVSKGKLAAPGGAPGQVLGTDGANLVWQNPGSGGGISGVTAGQGLTGGGSSGIVTLDIGVGDGLAVAADYLAILDGGVTSNKIANDSIGSPKIQSGAVTKIKLAASGGSAGQVLALAANGADLEWKPDNAGGLTLPYSGSGSSGSFVFQITNNAAGPGIAVNSAGNGVSGFSSGGHGVYGLAGSATPFLPSHVAGVFGESTGGNGVVGFSTSAAGVWGDSGSADGVLGSSSGNSKSGVYGEASSASGYGVTGRNMSTSTWGYLSGGVGAYGEGGATFGVLGKSASWAGVRGESQSGYGVEGRSTSSHGVYAETSAGSMAAVMARNDAISASACLACSGDSGPSAGSFTGNVFVAGNVTVSGSITAGTKPFKIDHPLDPENKVLYHVAVESPDMKNIYDGVVATDGQGLATVHLPEWFEALNRDFRYQLTVIGGGTWARARVAREIEGNAFIVETDVPHTRVSWQVTGIRHDPFAEVHRVPVEEDKPESERGQYLHPEAYARPGAETAMSGR